MTAIQCAGNRREDMTNVKPVKGLGWSCGAISNSEWTGVLLRDVLEHAGVDVNDPEGSGIEHVQFEGERPGRKDESRTAVWMATEQTSGRVFPQRKSVEYAQLFELEKARAAEESKSDGCESLIIPFFAMCRRRRLHHLCTFVS